MKIAFVFLSRYPTNKAYGVTSKYTIAALQGLGHDVVVLSPSSELSFFRNHVLNKVTNKFLNIGLNFSDRDNFFSRIRFWIMSLFWIGLLRYHFRQVHYDFIWARHLLVWFFTKRSSLNFCEIHSVPNAPLRWLLNTSTATNLFLGPISPFLLELVGKLFKGEIPFVYSPMAVPSFFFKRLRHTNYGEKIRLGYVGRLTSTGIDQGVSTFIQSFVDIRNLNSKEITLSLVGVSDSELSDFAFRTGKSLIKFREAGIHNYSHIEHEAIPQVVEDIDIFVIPYQENNRFKGRFPIKALEYAALGKPIICCESSFMRDIFKDTHVWFYESEPSSSLNKTLLEVLENPGLAYSKIVAAQNLALGFTYDIRAKSIIDFVSARRNKDVPNS